MPRRRPLDPATDPQLTQLSGLLRATAIALRLPRVSEPIGAIRMDATHYYADLFLKSVLSTRNAERLIEALEEDDTERAVAILADLGMPIR